MSATGIRIFASTLQTTNIWLDDIMRELGWNDRHKAYHALRSVLQTLRDRLSVDEARCGSGQKQQLLRVIRQQPVEIRFHGLDRLESLKCALRY